ncbi:MAG: SAM-dependent methyltransferase [Actinobacteria bacterium]|nr:SAM-dependent methyltransferase [Actinomycetota bacterium]MBI3687487.1 SAM-dependent methyltransferase [Actinomycetota bacterium]
MTEALYGPDGFYRRENPAAHFRTSVHSSPLFAVALATLAEGVDAALGHPDRFDLVDVGAGRGELLSAVTEAVPDGLRRRLHAVAVEVAARPPGLDPAVDWTDQVPPVTGLLLANEWLDNVPVDVVELTADGPRVLLVEPTGEESFGPSASAADRAWLDRWWPLTEIGSRAEVGRSRDDAWAGSLGRLRRGAALAIDYMHDRPRRASGGYPVGTLTGFRAGRQVPPVPDGLCDLTAHVALDSCAHAGRSAGALDTLLTTQRAALRALGVRGQRPPHSLASAAPAEYVAALSRAGHAAELTNPTGMGGFGWLLQTMGISTRTALPGVPELGCRAT